MSLSTMCLGVAPSGFPMPKSMMSSPRLRAAAFNSLVTLNTYAGSRVSLLNSSMLVPSVLLQFFQPFKQRRRVWAGNALARNMVRQPMLLCGKHDLHRKRSRRVAGGVVAGLILQHSVNCMVAWRSYNWKFDGEVARVHVQLVVRIEAEAEGLSCRILEGAGFDSAGRLQGQRGGNQQLGLRRMRVDVVPRHYLEAKFQRCGPGCADRLRFGRIQDVGLWLCGRVHASYLGNSQLRVYGCGEYGKCCDGCERTSDHFAPDEMVSFTIASNWSLPPRPAVTSMTLPVLST